MLARSKAAEALSAMSFRLGGKEESAGLAGLAASSGAGGIASEPVGASGVGPPESACWALASGKRRSSLMATSIVTGL